MDQGTGLSVIESVLNSAQMSTRLTILTSYLGQVVCGQLGVGDTGLSGQGEIVGCGRYWPVWAGRDSWVWEILACLGRERQLGVGDTGLGDSRGHSVTVR